MGQEPTAFGIFGNLNCLNECEIAAMSVAWAPDSLADFAQRETTRLRYPVHTYSLYLVGGGKALQPGRVGAPG